MTINCHSYLSRCRPVVASTYHLSPHSIFLCTLNINEKHGFPAVPPTVHTSEERAKIKNRNTIFTSATTREPPQATSPLCPSNAWWVLRQGRLPAQATSRVLACCTQHRLIIVHEKTLIVIRCSQAIPPNPCRARSRHGDTPPPSPPARTPPYPNHPATQSSCSPPRSRRGVRWRAVASVPALPRGAATSSAPPRECPPRT